MNHFYLDSDFRDWWDHAAGSRYAPDNKPLYRQSRDNVTRLFDGQLLYLD